LLLQFLHLLEEGFGLFLMSDGSLNPRLGVFGVTGGDGSYCFIEEVPKFAFVVSYLIFEALQLFLVQDFGLFEKEFLSDKGLSLLGQTSVSFPQFFERPDFEALKALVQ
jgi:hypothetical protein